MGDMALWPRPDPEETIYTFYFTEYREYELRDTIGWRVLTILS